MRNQFLVFPSGFVAISRVVSPQALDKVYVKGHSKQVYLISRRILRTEQRSWALNKYSTPTTDEAWNLGKEALAHVKERINKLNTTRRKSTWRERWDLEELLFLRSLLLYWVYTNTDNTKRENYFIVDDFMAINAPTKYEKNVWFTCPDGSVPFFTVEYESEKQSAGSLWVDEEWENSLESRVMHNPVAETKKDLKTVIQMMWRFIPVDIDFFELNTEEPPTAKANSENLASEEEVVQRIDQMQYIIAAQRSKARN